MDKSRSIPDDKKPFLRVVTEEEGSSSPKEVVSGPTVSVPYAQVSQPSPSNGRLHLEATLDSVQAEILESAAHLANAALRLSSTALDVYQQAQAHAFPGTFRNDIPPGMKSAEATEAWILTHLRDLRSLSRSSSAIHYTRSEDLKEAVKLASAELDRAGVAGDVAGLKTGNRIEEAFQEAISEIETRPIGKFRDVNMYMILGTSFEKQKMTIPLFVKGVVVGLVLSYVL